MPVHTILRLYRNVDQADSPLMNRVLDRRDLPFIQDADVHESVGGRASLEELMAIEVNLVGKFARGCKAAGIEIFELLTAVSSSEAQAKSRIMPLRVLGKKHKTVVDVGFTKLAIFKPGMIVGNAHTPRWITLLTHLIPDSLGWGSIRQEEVARAFVAHLEKRVPSQNQSVVSYGNKEMKRLIQ